MAVLMRVCLMAALAAAVSAATVADCAAGDVGGAGDDECSALQVRSSAGPQVQSKVPISPNSRSRRVQPSAQVCTEDAPVDIDPSDVGFIDDPESEEIRANRSRSRPWQPCSSPYRACVDGYRMPAACSQPFRYRGTEYQSCVPDSIVGPWCATSPTYNGRWEYCVPCTEQSIMPADLQDMYRAVSCKDIVITGGSMARGSRAFTFINGWTPGGAQRQFPAFSAGKWPGTVAIAGAVNTGHLSWGTRAAEVFEWWTKDAGDPRSRVTLRNLLHFSSGFYAANFTEHFDIPCLTVTSILAPTTTEECAQEIYENAGFNESLIGAWDDDTSYNSLHQVIALAMATKTTGMCPSDYLQRYLYEPAGMTRTLVYPSARPILSAFMLTTVDDYDSFLLKYLTYQILPKEIADVIEADSGNGAVGWINAMGIATADTVKSWGGSLYASVDRRTQTYQLISPPVTEYPGGAYGAWAAVNPFITASLAQDANTSAPLPFSD